MKLFNTSDMNVIRFRQTQFDVHLYPRVWSRSWSLSFEGDSDSRPYLFYLDLCIVLLQCICYVTSMQFILHVKLWL